LGNALAYCGEPEESIKYNEIAVRTNPKDTSIFFRFTGIAAAHFVAGRYTEAAYWASKSIHRKPTYLGSHALLAASLSHLNELEKARQAVEYCQKILPDTSISKIQQLYRRPGDAQRFIEGLRLAGFPE